MKILVLSIYPAPYRYKLFEYFRQRYEVDVFFENHNGDNRSAEWFSKGHYDLLDTDEGHQKYKKAVAHIKDYDIVAVYDYTTKESIKLILRCQLLGVPYVVNSDGVKLSNHKKIIREILKKILIKKASAYFVSGKNAENYVLEYGASRSRIYTHTFSSLEKRDIIEKPLTTNQKKELRLKLSLPVDKKIAIAVGRFIPLKRYGELIYAWRNMPSQYMLLLIGGGSEFNNYQEIIMQNNISNIIIQDYHPYEELLEYYKASDIFVHPTSYDVWGLVVNEAMANGLPVVASDHCVAGLELIRNGVNGYITKMGDEDKLCEKVISILCDDKTVKSMGKAAIKAILPYTIENMAEVHMEAFEVLYAKKIANAR